MINYLIFKIRVLPVAGC